MMATTQVRPASAEKATSLQQDPADDHSHHSDELTCAICLDAVENPVDLAIVRGCEHMYHSLCILQWSIRKANPTCPQCKGPFQYLYVHKQLDGSVSDFPVEESVCLLQRATWFTEHVRTLENGGKISAAMAVQDDTAGGSASLAGLTGEGRGYEEYDVDDYEQYDAEYDEDELIERYYFSSAAGRARVVIGNRRFGEGGSMRSGQRYARPVVPTTPTVAPPNKGSNGGKIGKPGNGGKAGAGSSGAGNTGSSSNSNNRNGASGSSSRAAAGPSNPPRTANKNAAGSSAAAPAHQMEAGPSDSGAGTSGPQVTAEGPTHTPPATEAATSMAATVADASSSSAIGSAAPSSATPVSTPQAAPPGGGSSTSAGAGSAAPVGGNGSAKQGRRARRNARRKAADCPDLDWEDDYYY